MNLNYVALLLKIQKASLCEEMKTIQVYVRKWKNACLVCRLSLSDRPLISKHMIYED